MSLLLLLLVLNKSSEFFFCLLWLLTWLVTDLTVSPFALLS
jgi:hypothetical protein